MTAKPDPSPAPKPIPESSLSGTSSQINALIGLLSGQGAREGYLAGLDQAVISLSNFLATVILARQVSPTELGVYGVGFITLRLVRAVQEGFVVQPLSVFGAALDDRSFRHYATSTSLIQLLLAAASSLAVATCGWLLTVTGNDVAGPTLFGLWFALLGWQLHEYARRMLYTRGAVLSALLNSILANLLRLSLMAYWGSHDGLSGLAGLDAIAWGALGGLGLALWSTRNYWSRDLSGLRETWMRNWSFGRWVIGGTIANWLAVEFYPVLTAGMISFAAAGAYRALQNLVAPIHMLLRATDTFLTPRGARLFQKNGWGAVSRSMRLIYAIAGIPVLGLLALAVLFPESLLRLLYGETYLPYAGGMALMAVFYALWFSYWPLQTALKAVRQSRPIFIANLTATFSMFTIGIWAIQRWGVYGTIGGQALNSLVVSAILWASWLHFRREARATSQTYPD